MADTIYQPYDDSSQTPHRVQGYARTFSRTPDAPFVERPVTLTERTGPIGVEQRLAVGAADFTRTSPDGPRAQGPLMLLHGRVVDEDGNPVAGAMVEVWHANASGKYIHEDDGFNAIRSQLYRRWPRRHRCGWTLHHNDGEAWPVSRRTRVMARAAHPFLHHRPKLDGPDGDADALPR